jgi:hypothetical protein
MIADHNLVKKSFGPMIADHNLVKKRCALLDAEVSTHTFLTMIIEESPIVQIAKYLTADNSVFQYSNANDMHVTQDLNSLGEIIAHAQCSVDEKINHFFLIQIIFIYIFPFNSLYSILLRVGVNREASNG